MMSWLRYNQTERIKKYSLPPSSSHWGQAFHSSLVLFSHVSVRISRY